jgi:hypothetical protein
MSSVARLVFTYFTCRPLMRAFSGIGLAGLVVLTVLIYRIPYLGAEWGAAGVVISWALVFVGSLHMPTMVAALKRSHVIAVLPNGRSALYWSAFVTVLLVSIPIPLMSLIVQAGMWHAIYPNPDPQPFAWVGFVAYAWMHFAPALFFTSWLYVALWLAMSKRSVAGVISGMVVMVLVVLVPTRLIITQDTGLLGPTILCVATWLVFAAYFFWPSRLNVKWPMLSPAARFRAGREIDLILGTASPWSLAIPILVPVLFAISLGKYSLSAWLLMMTIFSAVSGGIAASAAARSRAIWLRTRWSREQLFAQVERRFWRHNGLILAVLIVLLVAVGLFGRLPAEMLVRGVPLMALGMALSTYLGLMQTQRLRVPDSVVAALIMVTLMVLAVWAASGQEPQRVYGVEIVLAAVAVALRFTARARWTGLDWRLCRAEPGTAARSTA